MASAATYCTCTRPGRACGNESACLRTLVCSSTSSSTLLSSITELCSWRMPLPLQLGSTSTCAEASHEQITHCALRFRERKIEVTAYTRVPWRLQGVKRQKVDVVELDVFASHFIDSSLMRQEKEHESAKQRRVCADNVAGTWMAIQRCAEVENKRRVALPEESQSA